MKTFVCIMLWLYFAVIVTGETVVRGDMPPLPTPYASKPSKSQQARLLREAAEVLEAAEIRKLQELQNIISNKFVKLDFSTDKTAVKITAVSFMPDGTNDDKFLMQVSFESKEK